MLIHCPNCATRFNVPDGVIGERGRKLKCPRCGHLWHQQPVAATLSAPPAAAPPQQAMRSMAPSPPMPAAPPPPQASAPPPPPPPQPVPQASMPEMGGAAPAPAAMPRSPIPFEMEPGGGAPPPPKQEEDDEVPDLDEIMGRIGASNAEEGRARRKSAGGMGSRKRSADPFDDDSLGDDGLSDLLDGEDDDDLAGLDSLINGEDADSLPDVFTGPRPKKAEPTFPILKTLVMTMIVVWLLALGGFFFKAQILSMVPQLQPIYDALHINFTLFEDEQPELTIINATAQFERSEGGEMMMVVHSLLVNRTPGPLPIPPIRLELADGDGTVVQTHNVDAPQPQLQPNEEVSLEVAVDVPGDGSLQSWALVLDTDALSDSMSSDP